MLWVAGFDIIYACQDVDFDRQVGLHSLPKRLGIARALWTSRAMHLLMLALLLWLAQLTLAGVLTYVGLAVVAALLTYEHALVKPSDLSRVNTAFFTVNGFISVLLFLFWGFDILLR